eukprot:6200041-Pleurochrysis_carterae.AAC.3
MSSLVISHFHRANPQMRIILTLREPVVRMYSYFAMQATHTRVRLRSEACLRTLHRHACLRALCSCSCDFDV